MYDEGMDPRERRVRSHTARVTILALLAKDQRELTAEQIRAELPDGPTLRSVYYHLRILGTSRLVVEDGGSYRLS